MLNLWAITIWDLNSFRILCITGSDSVFLNIHSFSGGIQDTLNIKKVFYLKQYFLFTIILKCKLILFRIPHFYFCIQRTDSPSVLRKVPICTTGLLLTTVWPIERAYACLLSLAVEDQKAPI